MNNIDQYVVRTITVVVDIVNIIRDNTITMIVIRHSS